MRGAIISFAGLALALVLTGPANAQAQVSLALGAPTVTLEREQWTCLASRLQRYQASQAPTIFIPLVGCATKPSAADAQALTDTLRATNDITLSSQSSGGSQAYLGSLRLTREQLACLIKIRDAVVPMPAAGALKIDFANGCKVDRADAPARAAPTAPAAPAVRVQP
jgi:hypothetical protein